MSFFVEHVITGKKAQVNDEQWKKMQQLFPRMFRKIQITENYSDEAKKIIAQSEEE